jgi:hypothetical protein
MGINNLDIRYKGMKVYRQHTKVGGRGGDVTTVPRQQSFLNFHHIPISRAPDHFSTLSNTLRYKAVSI